MRRVILVSCKNEANSRWASLESHIINNDYQLETMREM